MRLLSLLSFFLFACLHLFLSSIVRAQTWTLNDVNLINYKGDPDSKSDTSIFSFSDQGAWFSFAIPTKSENFGGFSGPFLYSQQKGVWMSNNACQLVIEDWSAKRVLDWNYFKQKSTSFRSHLIQQYENEEFKITQTLFYTSSKSAYLYTTVLNKTDKAKKLKFKWKIQSNYLEMSKRPQSYGILFKSPQSDARILIYSLDKFDYVNPRDPFPIQLKEIDLPPGEMYELNNGISVLFKGDDFKIEQDIQKKTMMAVLDSLESREIEKLRLSSTLKSKLDSRFQDSSYVCLLNKCLLTLQNNWRGPSGEFKYDGLFPGYQNKELNRFRAWDSWKHAAALAFVDTSLAKNQIRSMYEFMDETGCIPESVFRDTTVEKPNYNNSNPPLSAWSTWKVYEASNDEAFLAEMFPKLLQQHQWWYVYRDLDQDGLCEYGSMDNSLINAKKESGMDNAVRFDQTIILNRGDSLFSMNQESVDLNSYLYLEKNILSKIAGVLKKDELQLEYSNQANKLKIKIQEQFFDDKTGWFYDTSIDGKSFVNVMGCEGWIPLWTEVASQDQAEKVKNTMMSTAHFFGTLPFQSLSVDHPKFQPDGGRWRGALWLDQAYFGVQGLHIYGFHSEAYKAANRLLRNGEGVLKRGVSIRENYHPQTGKGFGADLFSWTSAHYILLLINK